MIAGIAGNKKLRENTEKCEQESLSEAKTELRGNNCNFLSCMICFFFVCKYRRAYIGEGVGKKGRKGV